MKTLSVNKSILEELAKFSKSILNFDFSTRITIDYNDDLINEIASNLNLLADKLMLNPPEADSNEKINISHFISVISSFANHDFSQKLPVSEHGTILDAIATGINMLGDELEQTTASKDELETERNLLNEAQAIAKVGNWEFYPLKKQLTGSKEFFRIFELDCVPEEEYYDTYRKKHPEDDLQRLDELFMNIFKIQDTYTFEHRIICNNGTIRHLSSIMGEVTRDSNNMVVCVKGTTQDITDRKNAEIELNNSFNIVTEQNKRLLNFSYIVSHNLRSHTSNITSLLLLLEEEETKEGKEHLMNHIRNVSNLLNETMINLNDVVSIQKNINLIIESLSLRSYVDKAIEVLSEQIVLKKVTIENNVSREIVVNYNPAYLESIVLNFISNAIKYSSPERKPVVHIDAFAENEFTVFQIKDNGQGIDLKKYGEKLFGMYKTFHGNKDARGIGLFICKNQIETMGGKIEVASELGIGTTFKIYIK
ncbi:MAG TPA: ATP-binding protein [Bacteroidia bacterium]|nr:ATP-binding protein [Bacteroidia bacterium]